MILRNDKTVRDDDLNIFYESKEQQHAFNFPYQVGTNGDNPNKAESNAHNVKNGDILVVGSDGLWDNLHRNKIVDIVKPYFIRNKGSIKDDVDIIAEIIAKEAEKYSLLQNYMSPFAENARNYNYEYIGGKPDDITVVVG